VKHGLSGRRSGQVGRGTGLEPASLDGPAVPGKGRHHRLPGSRQRSRRGGLAPAVAADETTGVSGGEGLYLTLASEGRVGAGGGPREGPGLRVFEEGKRQEGGRPVGVVIRRKCCCRPKAECLRRWTRPVLETDCASWRGNSSSPEEGRRGAERQRESLWKKGGRPYLECKGGDQ